MTDFLLVNKALISAGWWGVKVGTGLFSVTTFFVPSWILNHQRFVKASNSASKAKSIPVFPFPSKMLCIYCFWTSLVTQQVKNPHAMQGILVWFLGWEDPLEEGIAIHSSFHAWRIPMDRGAGWAAVMGSQRVGHDWETKLNTYCFCDIHYSILWWVMALNSWKHVRSWKQDWSDFSGGHTVCHIVSTQCRFVGIE